MQSVLCPTFVTHMPDPILPPELERRIFELRALATPVSAPILMLVAWRVKEWSVPIDRLLACFIDTRDFCRIEPILYRTIVRQSPGLVSGYGPPAFTSRESLSATIRSKPRDFFRDSVRRLYLFDREDKDGYNEILSICSRVETLWVRHDGVDLSAHEPSTLKHLYTFYIPPLLRSEPTAPSDLFAQLTHLEITGRDPYLSDPQIDAFGRHVAQLPRLMYIAFTEGYFARIYACLLQRCPALRVLLSAPSWPSELQELGPLVRDARFVLWGGAWQWIEDAQRSAGAGATSWGFAAVDYWGIAERFVAKRLSGEVDRECVLRIMILG